MTGYKLLFPLGFFAALGVSALPFAVQAQGFNRYDGAVVPSTQLQQPDVKRGEGLRVAGPSVSEDQPVMLEAEQMGYDQQNGIVIAAGNVEVIQGETTLLADRITYDQNHNIVKAIGNVSVLEPTGNVYFANEVELQTAMKTGVIHEFRARLADNSVFAAREAKRISETVTELRQAVYSPCAIVCDDGTPKAPLWQFKADKVTIDTEAQKIRYRDAWFDVYGIPVAYTPYLAHPTPGADNQSGILRPTYSSSNTFGTSVAIPVYYSIKPDRDVTLTPILTTKEGAILTGEYRQRYDKGEMLLFGSITNPRDRDNNGNRAPGNSLRGHVASRGSFLMDDNWDWGFSVNRATDDTYMRRYKFGYDTQLTSRVFAQAYNFIGDGQRTYGIVQGLAFQGLTEQDSSRTTPLIAPLADVEYQTEPAENGSRVKLQGNVMSLMRDEGADSRRISATGSWNLPYITRNGHMFEMGAKLRGDMYNVADVPRQGVGLITTNTAPTLDGNFDGTIGRLLPQVSASWKYPLIKRLSASSIIIEPRADVIVSPNRINPSKIPNEDSATPEFTDVNLFSDNRFPGLDRVETGPRVNYGLRASANLDSGKNVSFLAGQTYRVNDDPLFPLSNDPGSRFSDYVGRFALTYQPLDFTYRFRLDKDDYTLNRSEVDTTLSFERVQFAVTYLSLKNDPVLASREEIVGSANVSLTPEWTLFASTREDLNINKLTTASAGLHFNNECLAFLAIATRDLTSDRDIDQSTSFIFQVGLKNLE